MVKKLKPLLVQQTLIEQGLELFTPSEFVRAFSVSLRAARGFINDHAQGEKSLFMKLRNGLYALRTHLPPEYAIANKLYTPSYISLETALSHYGVIPETVYTITSVTTKITREFETPWLIFAYHKIKKSAYTGYTQIKQEGRVVLIAEPEKALADYLYFVDLKRKSLNDRLELKKLSRKKVDGYAKLFGRKNLLELVNKVYADSKKPRVIH
jgi:hypothetical protein